MNDTLTPVRSVDLHRHRDLASSPRDDRRITHVDRLSLRIGLWLLLRTTRRIDALGDRERRVRQWRNGRDRADRELAAAREHLLHSVRA